MDYFDVSQFVANSLKIYYKLIGIKQDIISGQETNLSLTKEVLGEQIKNLEQMGCSKRTRL